MSLERRKNALGLASEGYALECCAIARQELERGDFEAARRALGVFWLRIGEAIRLDGLDSQAQATLLLLVGILTSRLGSYKQVANAQEIAKDLLSQSATLFESLGQVEDASEARIYLAVCYVLQARFDEGRIMLNEVLNRVGESGTLTIKALLWLAIAELNAQHHETALQIHRRIKPLSVHLENSYLRATCHSEYARTLQTIISSSGRFELVDEAMMEFTAASYYFGEAGNFRFKHIVENNLGSMLVSINRHNDALEHLDKAWGYFEGNKDVGIVARINESRARALIGLGRYLEAVRLMKAAVRSLEGSDHGAVVVEVLTTYGVALARSNNYSHAHNVFLQAIQAAKENEDREGEGRALLALLEEIENLPTLDIRTSLTEAHALLAKTQDASIRQRLLDVAIRLYNQMGLSEEQLQEDERPDADSAVWQGFDFAGVKREFERSWVIKAMNATGGNVLRASKLLGFPKPQRLYQLLKEHHLEHLQARRHHKPIIHQESVSKVSDLYSYVEFTLPSGVTKSDVCTMHQISTGVLMARGVQPSDYVLIKVCQVDEGELVGVNVYGGPYQIGFLIYEGDYIRLVTPDSAEEPRSILKTGAHVDGRVVGYLKAEDVKGYKKGTPVKSYSL